MHTCETCQTVLLEYLYDLLDESERQPLQDHLAGCAACQAALQRARQQQQLLAAAARIEFPAVVFQPPVEQTVPEASPVPAAPAVLPMPAARAALRPAATGRRWRRAGPWPPPCFWASGSPFRASGWAEIILGQPQGQRRGGRDRRARPRCKTRPKR